MYVVIVNRARDLDEKTQHLKTVEKSQHQVLGRILSGGDIERTLAGVNTQLPPDPTEITLQILQCYWNAVPGRVVEWPECETNGSPTTMRLRCRKCALEKETNGINNLTRISRSHFAHFYGTRGYWRVIHYATPIAHLI